MSVLLIFVLGYILLNVILGLYGARLVKTSDDFVLAGRSLPIYVTIATVFATWFGAEAVLGVSGTFASEGGNMGAIIGDPFGAGLCLIFVGVFFAARLYRMKLTTIADFFRRRYNRGVEVFVSIAICISYIGWVSAQVVALGLVINVVSEGAISQTFGMLLGAVAVMIYTTIGGMFSIAITDFLQMVVIVVGIFIAAFLVAGDVPGGAGAVFSHASELNKYDFWPEFDFYAIMSFIGLFIPLAFGSIPQQDVFQRVMSAKDEKTAVWGTIIGATFYIFFCFVPVFIAVAATMIDPAMLELEGEQILPTFFMTHMPMWVKIILFGALLSAILSTASGTLLAPSAIFAENILKETFNLDDKTLLFALRMCVFTFGIIVFGYAYWSENSGLTVFEMVGNAYLVTLCGAFIPLAFGVYWSKANTYGAVISIVCGVGTWFCFEVYNIVQTYEMFHVNGEAFPIDAHVIGFVMAILGMVVGSLLTQTINPPKHISV